MLPFHDTTECWVIPDTKNELFFIKFTFSVILWSYYGMEALRCCYKIYGFFIIFLELKGIFFSFSINLMLQLLYITFCYFVYILKLLRANTILTFVFFLLVFRILCLYEKGLKKKGISLFCTCIWLICKSFRYCSPYHFSKLCLDQLT